MNRVVVYPGNCRGVQLPGDKSVSQRVAILASLACGTSEVTGYLDGEDAQSTLAAMVALGASVERKPDGVLVIRELGVLA